MESINRKRGLKTHDVESKLEHKLVDESVNDVMSELKNRMDTHPIWSNRLKSLRARSPH